VSVSLALWASGQSLVGAEVNVTRTNRFDHWITNVIEVRMPDNRFVNEYRTNWVTQLRTNIVDVYATNRVTRTLTNPVVVQALWTNYVTAYETNWNMRKLTNLVMVQATRTNVVVLYQTNLTTRTLTNRVAVNVLLTNSVDRYQTNWSTLSLTNWETVVLFQTNWITQTVTNVVQIDMPIQPVATAPAAVAVVEPKETPVETASSVLAGAWAGPLAIEAARTTRPPANELVEVQLKARWNGNATTPLQVQSWRVEREDGAVLFFGQEQAFKRQLPVGKYKVEAKVRADGDNPPLSARGTLSVTTREAVIQQRLLVKK
jgi:hypothetical protein